MAAPKKKNIAWNKPNPDLKVLGDKANPNYNILEFLKDIPEDERVSVIQYNIEKEFSRLPDWQKVYMRERLVSSFESPFQTYQRCIKEKKLEKELGVARLSKFLKTRRYQKLISLSAELVHQTSNEKTSSLVFLQNVVSGRTIDYHTDNLGEQHPVKPDIKTRLQALNLMNKLTKENETLLSKSNIGTVNIVNNPIISKPKEETVEDAKELMVKIMKKLGLTKEELLNLAEENKIIDV